jgi:hypothetical protein
MSHFLKDVKPDDIVLDALPDEVLGSMETRDRWMASLRYAEGALEFLIADLQAWTPGQTIRVAFLGGSTDLHQAIENATREISEAGNLVLDFKRNGAYRTWTPGDTEYAGEIRVSFDEGGYFSLVGTDSINPNIGLPQQTVGGRPNQRSLNLGGFDVALPATWQGTVRHEFLHALSFHHEHQNMRGPCEAAFRWEDDPGYQPTTDSRGAYVPDAAGRRPGIYTYLSGYPNGWSKAKIDFNLRTPADSRALVAGPFDAASVMLYRFPALFYRAQPSPCAPAGDGQLLSDGDKRGLKLLYPKAAAELSTIADRREGLLKTIEQPGRGRSEESFESVAPDRSGLASDAMSRLRRSLKQMRA